MNVAHEYISISLLSLDSLPLLEESCLEGILENRLRLPERGRLVSACLLALSVGRVPGNAGWLEVAEVRVHCLELLREVRLVRVHALDLLHQGSLTHALHLSVLILLRLVHRRAGHVILERLLVRLLLRGCVRLHRCEILTTLTQDREDATALCLRVRHASVGGIPGVGAVWQVHVLLRGLNELPLFLRDLAARF